MAGKGEINVILKAQEMGLSMEQLATAVEADFQESIRDLAHGAYARIVAEAQEKLHATRKDYLKGLNFTVIGQNQYLITLDGDYANKLEGGSPSYDMRDTLLKSNKTVSTGSRSGLPWVQKAKGGGRFAHVPIQQHPMSKDPRMSDMAQAIKKLEAYNRSGKKQKITQMFKDAGGRPMEGKVATALPGGGGGMKDLEGLVKYQKIYKNADTGKQRLESVYVIYRTISDTGQGWMHPGMPGIHGFEQAEKWLEQEMSNLLKYYLD